MASQIKDSESLKEFNNKTDRNQKALKLLKETKILNITKLANMLVDLFGLEEGFKKVGKGKHEGQEVELYIPAIDGYITFNLVSKKENFECHADRAKNPVATVVVKVKEDKILKTLSKIIRSKANLFGLAKLAPKILFGKIKIKGSIGAALTLVKCLMIGKNDIYKTKF